MTPGQSYTVVVGAGGAGAVADNDGSIWTASLGSAGGESYFLSSSTVRATGGQGGKQSGNVNGGTNTAGDGGGSGGLA